MAAKKTKKTAGKQSKGVAAPRTKKERLRRPKPRKHTGAARAGRANASPYAALDEKGRAAMLDFIRRNATTRACSAAEIARRFEVSRNTVAYHARRLGVKVEKKDA